MIPALTNVPGIDPEYQAFFSALKEAGFTGDIETSFSSRLAVATDNSVYQWLPQGAVFPKSSDDVVCLVKLVSDPKFRKVRFTRAAAAPARTVSRSTAESSLICPAI